MQNAHRTALYEADIFVCTHNFEMYIMPIVQNTCESIATSQRGWTDAEYTSIQHNLLNLPRRSMESGQSDRS
jgi:hypothetical protein